MVMQGLSRINPALQELRAETQPPGLIPFGARLQARIKDMSTKKSCQSNAALKKTVSCTFAVSAFLACKPNEMFYCFCMKLVYAFCICEIGHVLLLLQKVGEKNPPAIEKLFHRYIFSRHSAPFPSIRLCNQPIRASFSVFRAAIGRGCKHRARRFSRRGRAAFQSSRGCSPFH